MKQATGRGRGFTPIGLDVGDGAIHAVQFSKHDGTLRLHGAFSQPIPKTNDASTQTSGVLSALIALTARNAFAGRSVVSSIPRHEVDIRPVLLPEGITADDVRFSGALKAEARLCLLYKPEDAVLDYLPFMNEPAEKKSQSAVLLVAARKEVLHRQLALLKSAGLECLNLDIAPCAAARILGDDESPYIAIDMGYHQTVVSMARGKALQFSRNVKFGLQLFIEELARAMNINAEEASWMIETYGFAAPLSLNRRLDDAVESGVVNCEMIPATLLEICGKPLDVLVAELKRSINYFALHPCGSKAERAFLMGPSLPLHLDIVLAGKLAIPVHTADAFDKLFPNTCAPAANGSAYVVAAGLATRSESP